MLPAEVTEIIGRTGELVTEQYIFADLGADLAALLTARAAAGRYSTVDSPETLGRLVTEDLQSVNGDRHLRLKYSAEPIPADPEAASLAWLEREAKRSLGGVGRVEWQPGNVGYLELRPILFPPSMSGPAVTAAMQLVAGTDALIIDLRRNVGGDPSMVALICGYLLDEPTLLFTMQHRDEADRQSWSLPYVPGDRFGGTKPLYLLTSSATFSGAEELCYDLQQHGRATIVGERTGGGAHPRVAHTVHPHLEVTVPVGRPVHPATGTNWEGTGIVPDIPVPAADALAAAHEHALHTLHAETPTAA
ncbi:MAG TPA: S41 family peptidase [Mycobacteriales bacterium]|nr:S41 family peptidase [Mycobacteriales bacterium]